MAGGAAFWTDAEMLDALERRAQGESAAVVARAMGRSRSAVLGLYHRIDTETDKADRTPRLNGTMPPCWWRKGLNRPGRAPL